MECWYWVQLEVVLGAVADELFVAEWPYDLSISLLCYFFCNRLGAAIPRFPPPSWFLGVECVNLLLSCLLFHMNRLGR